MSVEDYREKVRQTYKRASTISSYLKSGRDFSDYTQNYYSQSSSSNFAGQSLKPISMSFNYRNFSSGLENLLKKEEDQPTSFQEYLLKLKQLDDAQVQK